MVTLSTIQKDVRILLDHNEEFNSITVGTEILDDDQLNLDEIIENQVESAARMVMLSAPRSYINWSLYSFPDTASNNAFNATGVFKLPQDYLRFGMLKLGEWQKAVNLYSAMQDAEYSMQQSEFEGIKATNRKPVVILAESGEGGMEVQTYPFEENDTLKFTYCKQPKIVTDTTDNNTKKLDITDTLYRPFIYMLGAMVAEVLKDTEKSNELMTASKAMLTNPDEVVQQTNQ